MSDIVMFGIMVFGFPYVVVAFVSWIFHYFVALRSEPTRRAAWTVGLAYLVAAVFCLAAVPEYWWAGPLAPVPATLIAFWWWRKEFRRDWIDDSEGVPEGVELANDDWRVGLIFVGLVATILIGRFLLKLASAG